MVATSRPAARSGGERQADVQAFTIRLPRDLHDDLRTVSFLTGRSMNELIVVALRKAREGRRRAQ